jgi:hypothetical protein
MISDALQLILFFGILGTLISCYAMTRGFYTWTPHAAVPISMKQVGSIFGIYMSLMLIFGPIFISILAKLTASPPFVMGAQFGLLGLTIATIVLYCQSQKGNTFSQIWKDRSNPNAKSIWFDIGIGIMTWIVAFPFIVVVGEFFDTLINLAFQADHYEQTAVKYLKNTLGSPLQTALALLLILGVAPFFEEFLFRGCLQTYLKRRFGVKGAILLSSLCFAVFHFSTSQGWGNISLLASLMTFAGFLGFIYERQSSLFASIALHATFNLTSAFRILLFGDSG